ncbi:MAG: DUF3179 domain-containing protein [Acidimicrobiales bacterium]
MTVALLATACSGPASEPVAPASEPPTTTTSAPTVEDYPDAITRRLHRMANEPRPVEPSALPPRHLDAETFPVSLVPRERIVWGGLAPDAIPAIDDPVFEPASSVDWLDDREAVLVLQLDAEPRAYPIQVLMWHEIVNDEVGGRPVAVTYCPLCNSGVAFDRTVDERTLDFGTSGSLYLSGLVMYDRQTESLWTHFDGRAVVGTLAGAELELLPMSTVAWADFRQAHPDAEVLSKQTGYDRPYGRNAYRGYDQSDGPLRGFFPGEVDPRQAGMARVVGFGDGDQAVAVLTDHLAEVGVVNLELDGRPVVAWHVPGTASALHRERVADGDDVGATGVFFTDGSVFARDGPVFVDDATGTTWNVLGEAVRGPRKGEHLEPVTHLDTFWFAWSSYRPETALVG